MEKILFIMPAAKQQVLQNVKIRQTGYFLNEFYETYKALLETGFDIDFASPNGETPTIDEESLKDKYWKKTLELRSEALQVVGHNIELQKPQTLDEVSLRLSDYKALVVPGGQGVMVDLFYDQTIPQIILHFARNQKPIGLICHAPALLLNLPDDHPLKGFKVTSVSGFEEWFIETFIMNGKAKERKLGQRLEKAGYDYESAFPGRSHAIRHQYLVTSQNPYSSEEFNQLFTQTLKEAAR